MKNLPLRGVKNVRDLGGLPAGDGEVLRSGKLLRAGGLHRLKKRDEILLRDAYHLRTVIDLRSPQESEEKPDVRIEGVDYYSVPIFASSTLGITKERGANIPKLVATSKDPLELHKAIPDLRQVYPRVVTDADSVRQLGRAVTLIAEKLEEGGAILFHCTSGKDRTGILTALLLTLLGSDRETILEDYLYTNKVAERRAKLYAFLIRALKRDRIAAEKIRLACTAHESYLTALFDTMEQRYGSAESFIRDQLGITQERERSLRQSLLTPGRE